jgi:hypothetical protein
MTAIVVSIAPDNSELIAIDFTGIPRYCNYFTDRQLVITGMEFVEDDDVFYIFTEDVDAGVYGILKTNDYYTFTTVETNLTARVASIAKYVADDPEQSLYYLTGDPTISVTPLYLADKDLQIVDTTHQGPLSLNYIGRFFMIEKNTYFLTGYRAIVQLRFTEEGMTLLDMKYDVGLMAQPSTSVGQVTELCYRNGLIYAVSSNHTDTASYNELVVLNGLINGQQRQLFAAGNDPTSSIALSAVNDKLFFSYQLSTAAPAVFGELINTDSYANAQLLVGENEGDDVIRVIAYADPCYTGIGTSNNNLVIYKLSNHAILNQSLVYFDKRMRETREMGIHLANKVSQLQSLLS